MSCLFRMANRSGGGLSSINQLILRRKLESEGDVYDGKKTDSKSVSSEAQQKLLDKLSDG